MASKATKRGFGRTRKLPSGRWQAFYGDPDGAVKLSRSGKQTPIRHTAPRTFLTKVDAEGWLTDEYRMISLGTWTPPAERQAARAATQLTFGDYAETWLRTRKVKGQPLADRTRDGYRDLLDRFILPTFKDVALTRITPDTVDHWYEVTAVDTPTYRAQAYSLLRTILGTAVDRGLVKTANPAKVRGAGTAKRVHKVRPATLAEVGAIVAAMPERRRAMILLGAWCGMRFGELAELRRKDVDLKAKVIRVRRGVIRTTEHDADGLARTVHKVKTPKTDAGIRDVPIPPHIVPDLRAHLLEHTMPGRDGLLFPGGVTRDAEGKVIEVHHLTSGTFAGRASVLNKDGTIKRNGHGWYEARRLAGREDLHFHDLRHTGLTNAAVAGATLAELMALAGHSTPGAAMRYQHAAHDRMQDLAARLSKMAELQVEEKA